jgi:hypothetical protein
MAALLPTHLFTLLVGDARVELWNPEGQVLCLLPQPEAGATVRSAWLPLLQEHLPAKAPIQVLLQHTNLSVVCQDVPFLSPKERREAGERLMAAEGGGETLNAGAGLDVDAHADGGHQLWVAAHPAWEMREWLGALQGLTAQLVYVGPWQRALLAGLGATEQKDRLVLVLEVGRGNLLYFRGRALVQQRTFRIPDDLDPAALDATGAEVLLEVVVEELSRTLQFIKQKHRGVAFTEVAVLGLAELPGALEDRLARGLRIKATLASRDTRLLLLAGAGHERAHKDALTLVPLEVQEAARLRALRLGVWGAAALVLLLCGGGWSFLRAQERNLALDVAQAEVSLQRFRGQMEERDRAARARFPLVRLRAAEVRQAQAAQQLADLSGRLMSVPDGVRLERVEVFQLPGDTVAHRFTISGVARTRRDFSVGPLADYLARLGRTKGLQLQPLRDVQVLDAQAEGQSAPAEQALARFTLEGVSP